MTTTENTSMESAIGSFLHAAAVALKNPDIQNQISWLGASALWVVFARAHVLMAISLHRAIVPRIERVVDAVVSRIIRYEKNEVVEAVAYMAAAYIKWNMRINQWRNDLSKRHTIDEKIRALQQRIVELERKHELLIVRVEKLEQTRLVLDTMMKRLEEKRDMLDARIREDEVGTVMSAAVFFAAVVNFVKEAPKEWKWAHEATSMAELWRGIEHHPQLGPVFAEVFTVADMPKPDPGRLDVLVSFINDLPDTGDLSDINPGLYAPRVIQAQQPGLCVLS